MACKNARMRKEKNIAATSSVTPTTSLCFGVDTNIPADDLLQNNIDLFEWVRRNKIYPTYWGRNIGGENSLTSEEIIFLHRKGCKIAVYFTADGMMETKAQGQIMGAKALIKATELNIPKNTAVFLEINDNANVTTDALLGYAEILMSEGYVPGYKANTDAKHMFDREYSRGMQINREVFAKCLIWATAPLLAEYDRMTTTHFIHPDNWKPYAPSGVTRKEIAIWQYGSNCHPVNDDGETPTTFNINLVENKQVIIEYMF